MNRHRDRESARQLDRPQLQAVFFDMDGVLADTEPLHAEAYAQAFAIHGLVIDAATFAKEVTLGGRRVTDWFIELGGKASTAELYATKDKVYYGLVADRGLEPRPGLRALVADLVGNGVRISVVTSARCAVARRLLERFGLTSAFADVVGLEDVVRVKPAPDAYLTAIERAGVDAAAGVAIEDSPRGVAAARAAGLAAVAAPTAALRHLAFGHADLVADSLEQLSTIRLEQVLKDRGNCDPS